MFGGQVRLNRTGLFVVVILTLLLTFLHWLKSNRNIDRTFVPASMKPVSLKRLLAVMIDVAEMGGNEVVAVHKSSQLEAKVKSKTNEGADELLTNADIRSHITMVYGLMKAFRGIKVQSEEHNPTEMDIEAVETPKGIWAEVQSIVNDEMVALDDLSIWVDPLDATQEFSENLLDYVTVMVCAAVNSKPVIGVIHQPFLKKTYWAWVGKVHSLTTEVVMADRQVDEKAKGKKIIVSRSHAGQVEKMLKQGFGNETTIIPAGGAGYKVLQVIQGFADCYIHTTYIKKWDICAGNALLSALGGSMTSLQGEKIDYSLRSGPGVNSGLVAALDHHDTYVKVMAHLE